jgi:AcrR family transcriptional regulator
MPVEEQRQRILTGATAVFTAHGFDGATSEQIAEASGVARPTIYNLFGSKHDVFVATVDRALQRILDHLVAKLDTNLAARGREHALASIGAFFELVDSEPETIRMLQLADHSGDAPTRQAAWASRRRLEEAIGRYIRTAVEGFQGVTISAEDANLAATMVLAAVESAAFRHLEDPDRPTPEVVAFVAAFVWRALVWTDEDDATTG